MTLPHCSVSLADGVPPFCESEAESEAETEAEKEEKSNDPSPLSIPYIIVIIILVVVIIALAVFATVVVIKRRKRTPTQTRYDGTPCYPQCSFTSYNYINFCFMSLHIAVFYIYMQSQQLAGIIHT